MPESAATLAPARGKRFVVNVLWNWLGTCVSLFIGLVLSPYLIAKLGAEGYGVWALTFSLVEYCWLFDLGFRSATVKFVAHHAARGEIDEIRKTVSTAFVYSALAGGAILSLAVALGAWMESFFRIPESLRGDFRTLVILITLSWCLGLVFNLFNACVEAVQQFEYSNKASMVAATVRAVGQWVLLAMGFKLVAVGIVVVISQAIGYAANYFYYRGLFPGGCISLRWARLSQLRVMAGFGLHTFVMTMATQLLNQGAPLMIGHFETAAFVGYYALPVRLLQYTVELAARIGIVTNTNAAELAACGRVEDLAGLAVYANRYALVVFMPLAIWLGVFGPRLLAMSVGGAFAAHSAPVLAILLGGFVVGAGGQSSAGMLLQGLGRHQRYARGLLAEAVVGAALLWFVVPRWGIVGAASVVAALMLINRGLYSCWLVSKVIGLSFFEYMRAVYLRPFCAALPVFGLAVWMRANSADGWPAIAGAAVSIAGLYYALAIWAALEGSHRGLLREWMRHQGWLAQPASFDGRL